MPAEYNYMVTMKPLSFERIFCPIDLQPGVNPALRYAVALARTYGAHLSVCHCLESHEAKSAEIGLRQLDALTTDHIRFGTTPVPEWEPVLVAGDRKKAIAHAAAQAGADLLVVWARQRPHAAALFGSTVEALCRTAPCPVLVTHSPERDWAGLTTNESDPRKILVAYDFSSDAELALAYGLSLAQHYGSQLHVLHVLPWSSARNGLKLGEMPALSDRGYRSVRERLQNCLPAEVSPGNRIWPVVVPGQPYREILTYAEEQSVDLICMGVQGTGFGMKALFGSNVDRVLRQAPCPVLIARPLKSIQTDYAIA